MKIIRLLPFLVFACNNKTEKVVKDFTIDSLIMTIPSETKIVETTGIDSYGFYLISETNDTFMLQYGLPGINDMHPTSPSVFDINMKEAIFKRMGKNLTSDEALFSEYPVDDDKQKIFEKNFYLYDTVHSIVVKIVQPKRIGNGITGMYIPKLKNGFAFSIFSKNLDSSKHKDALQMFKTIRYK